MARINAHPCPGGTTCNCGNTVVSVADEHGKPILVAVLTRGAAQTLLAELTAAANGTAPQPRDRLHSIRCEGTA